MQYSQPFAYFVGRPGGFNNLLLASVCVLIPVVGPIVLLGYRAEVAEDLDRDPGLADYPDFKFDRFGKYLERGIWPFLYQLLIGLGAMVLVLLAFGVGFAGYAATQEPAVGVAAGLLMYVPIILFVTLIQWAFELHGQLSGRFEFGAAAGFASRFLGKVGGPAVVALLIFGLLGTGVVILGLLACYVGLFPASVILGMAEQHILAQLYRLYLDRGGEPIGGPVEELEYDER